MLQKEMQFRMTAGVDGDLKQRHEDVFQHFLEISQLLLCVVHVAVKEVIEERDTLVDITVITNKDFGTKVSTTHNRRGTWTSQRTLSEYTR